MTNGKEFKVIPEKMKISKKLNPLVSIVIPTYNRGLLLSRAIRSVLNQTYLNFELIVVDDCSQDSTESVVKSFHDERIRYIRHEKNQGASIARNNGIMASKGEYIAFQDSDDEWLPTKLEKQVKCFNFGPRDLGVVYTSFWLMDQGKKTLIPSPDMRQTDGKIQKALLEKNFVDTATAVVRKACFKRTGLFENIPRLQDWELWIRISKYYYFKHLCEPLVTVYRQPDSISRNTDALIFAWKFILSKYFDDISKNPNLLYKHYFTIGHLLCQKGDLKSGRSYFYKALSVNPFNAKILLWAIASTIGPTTYNKYATFYYMLKHTYDLKYKNRKGL